MSITLTVIGGGNMAKAIVQGAIEGGVLDGSEIAIADPDQASRDFFIKLGCIATESAQELPESSCTLLAVKPQIFNAIAPYIRSDVVYSIMAGVSTAQIADKVGHNCIVRIMPNLPCSIGFGAAGIAFGSTASTEDALADLKTFQELV